MGAMEITTRWSGTTEYKRLGTTDLDNVLDASVLIFFLLNDLSYLKT